MKNNYKNMSDHDLTFKLSKLNKELTKVKAKLKISNPKTPQEVVDQVKLNDEISQITELQISIGRELVHRDRQREEENLKRLNAKREDGALIATELLEMLPQFAEDINVAFTALGKQYGELLAMSKELHSIDQLMLNNSLPACMPAAIKLQPNNLHKVIKTQFKRSFSAEAGEVFLPRVLPPGGNIVVDVKMIIDQCSTEAG